MALVVVDSDVLIDALQGRDPASDRVAIGLETGTLATTTINVFELLSGAGSDRSRESVERMLEAMTILPLEDEAGRAAAEVRRALDTVGTPIGMADYLIAGICLASGAVLLTRNLEHFSRVPDLRLDPLFAE